MSAHAKSLLQTEVRAIQGLRREMLDQADLVRAAYDHLSVKEKITAGETLRDLRAQRARFVCRFDASQKFA